MRERTIFERYAKLAKSEARNLKKGMPSGVELADLTQEAYIGLIRAIKRGQPKRRGFERYVRLNCRGAMIDALRRTDPVGRPTRRRQREIHKFRMQTLSKYDREPTIEECAEVLQATPECALRWLTDVERIAGAITVSRDDASEDDGRYDPPIPDPDPATRHDKQEALNRILQAFCILPSATRLMMWQYYFKGRKMADVAAMFGVSEALVSIRCKQAIQMLRDYLHSPACR